MMYVYVFSTVEIDSRLGYFQKSFKLTANEVRSIAFRSPQTITHNLLLIKVNKYLYTLMLIMILNNFSFCGKNRFV